MFLGDFGGCRLLLCMFQTGILKAEPTVVEWFIFTPAIRVVFSNDRSVSMCVYVHVCMEGPSGHTLTGFRGFQWTSVRERWRWNSFRKVYLLRKLFESCLVWQGSENTFLMCHNFCFPFCLIFHAGMGEEKVLLWINKESLQLLRDGSFAFLRFCMGSQELQSTIKPVPCVSDFFTLSGWHGHTEILCLWCQCLWVVWKNLPLGIPPGRA